MNLFITTMIVKMNVTIKTAAVRTNSQRISFIHHFT